MTASEFYEELKDKVSSLEKGSDVLFLIQETNENKIGTINGVCVGDDERIASMLAHIMIRDSKFKDVVLMALNMVFAYIKIKVKQE